MEGERNWTTAEVCERYGISKSTLFRWEREGIISPPERDRHNYRVYTSRHRSEISDLLLRRSHQRLARSEGAPNAEERQRLLFEQGSLRKFLDRNEIIGLYELDEHERLSNDTIRLLLRRIQELDPSDDLFREVIRVVYDKTVGANRA